MFYSTLREETVVEKKCENPDCFACGLLQEIQAFQELGAVFLVCDDDVYCLECHEEMVDAL